MARRKLAVVNERDIIGIFLAPRPKVDAEKWTFVRQALQIKDAPDDLAIIGANFDFARQAFVIVLSSETFDDIPYGEILPFIEIQIQQVFVNEKDEITGILTNNSEGKNVVTWRNKTTLS